MQGQDFTKLLELSKQVAKELKNYHPHMTVVITADYIRVLTYKRSYGQTETKPQRVERERIGGVSKRYYQPHDVELSNP